MPATIDHPMPTLEKPPAAKPSAPRPSGVVWKLVDVAPFGASVPFELTGTLQGDPVAEFRRQTAERSGPRAAEVTSRFDNALAGLPEAVEVDRLVKVTAGYRARVAALTDDAASARAKIVHAAKTGELAVAERKKLDGLTDELTAYRDVLTLGETDLNVAREGLTAARKLAVQSLRRDFGGAVRAEEAALLAKLGEAVTPILAELHGLRTETSVVVAHLHRVTEATT